VEIIRGKIEGPQKVCIYGPEGIGKSTLAAQFPNPVFIDTEEAQSTWMLPDSRSRQVGRCCYSK